MKKKVLVLGDGPYGLSAAWELSKYGYDITVIEKNLKQVGYVLPMNTRVIGLTLEATVSYPKTKNLLRMFAG